MSTFLMPDQPMFVPGKSHPKLASLADWLGDHWALLFSEPADFSSDVETNESVRSLAQRLSEKRIKPLAVLPAERSLAQSWIHRLYEEECLVVLPEADEAIVLDVRERALRADLERLLPPYVIVVDPRLQRRATISYRTGAPRKPADVLTIVDLLQGAHASMPTKLEMEMG